MSENIFNTVKKWVILVHEISDELEEADIKEDNIDENNDKENDNNEELSSEMGDNLIL